MKIHSKRLISNQYKYFYVKRKKTHFLKLVPILKTHVFQNTKNFTFTFSILPKILKVFFWRGWTAKFVLKIFKLNSKKTTKCTEYNMKQQKVCIQKLLNFFKVIASTIRYKLSNKFWEATKSPSVGTKVGTNIPKHIPNPKTDSEKAIIVGKHCGSRSFEITFYLHQTGEFSSKILYPLLIFKFHFTNYFN